MGVLLAKALSDSLSHQITTLIHSLPFETDTSPPVQKPLEYLQQVRQSKQSIDSFNASIFQFQKENIQTFWRLAQVCPSCIILVPLSLSPSQVLQKSLELLVTIIQNYKLTTTKHFHEVLSLLPCSSVLLLSQSLCFLLSSDIGTVEKQIEYVNCF